LDAERGVFGAIVWSPAPAPVSNGPRCKLGPWLHKQPLPLLLLLLLFLLLPL
jgi:hypothetical protein